MTKLRSYIGWLFFCAVISTLFLTAAVRGEPLWTAYFPGEIYVTSSDPVEACKEVDDVMWGAGREIELVNGELWSSYGDPHFWGASGLHCATYEPGNECAIGGPTYGRPYMAFRCQDAIFLIPSSEGEKNAGKPNCELENGTNPIHSATGNKYQKEEDLRGTNIGSLKFERYYNSKFSLSAGFGRNWRSRYDRSIRFDSGQATVIRQDGKYIYLPYTEETDSYQITEPGIVYTLKKETSLWKLRTAKNNVETYNSDGQLVEIDYDNYKETITYFTDKPAYLIVAGLDAIEKVEDSSGRKLEFSYSPDGLITSIIGPSGEHVHYEYAQGILVRVRYESANHLFISREYHYEDPRFPHTLTGITDENGNRLATWTYDDQGRAISSEHAGGVDKHTLTFNEDGTTTVTNPLGKQTTYHFTTLHGVRKVTQVEGHPTATCEGANKAYTYDANGFLASKTDWKGNLTTYVRDDRGLELSRTEAAGTPEARTITTEWHTQLRLPVRITEPGKITEITYDAQGRELSRTVRESL